MSEPDDQDPSLLSLEEWEELGRLIRNPPPVPEWLLEAVRGTPDVVDDI